MKILDLGVFGRFRRNEDGNLAVIFSMCLVPIVLAVGMATDYSSATNNRSAMQNALDAATLALAALPETLTNPQREVKLREFYLGNAGVGTATLNSFTITGTGEVDAIASAAYDMPTSFMQLAKVTKVPISVVTEMHKEPTLTEAKFEVEKVSGFWNKTMTLKGKKYGSTTYDDLMRITYTYNGSGVDKGWGTSSVYKITKNGTQTQTTLIQQQVCNTKKGSTTYGQGSTLLTNNEMSKTPALTMNESASQTKCWFKSGLNSDTFIDVSQMNDIYLEMDVPSAANNNKPRYLRSNDPTTADRLFLDGVGVVPNGKPVDIFSAVPCGQTSAQAWEDGGSPTPGPLVAADFFYKVTGKCDYSERPVGISLTK